MSIVEGILLPLAALALVAALVPRGLARVFPEGLRPLLWLAATAAMLMWALAAGAFMLLYLRQGLPLAALFEAGPVAALGHFMKLGAQSALAWGPVLALSISVLPRGWREETW